MAITATAQPVVITPAPVSGSGGGKAPTGMEYNGQGALVPINNSTATPAAPSSTPSSTTPTPTSALTSPSALTSLPDLTTGASGAAVSTLQNYLVSQGYLTAAQVATGPGIYGPQTTAAVAAWQKANGIQTNGNAGSFGPNSKQFLQNPTTPPQGGVITPDQVTPQNALPLTDPTAAPTNTIAAGATATSQTLQQILDSMNLPETDTQKSADDITSRINDLMTEDIGKAADTTAALNAAGVPDLNKQLTNTNAEIQTLTAQRDQLTAEEQGKPITMDSIIGAKAQIAAVMDAKIGVATAQAQALMGNITLATNTANQAVDAKYGPIEQEIAIRQQQLALLQPTLDAEEKKQAAAQTAYLQQQQQQIQDQKDAEKQTQTQVLQWMDQYKDAGIALTDTLQQAQAKILASKSYQTEQSTLSAQLANEQRLASGSTGTASGVTSGTAPGTTGSSTIDATTPGYTTQIVAKTGGLTQSALDQAALSYALSGTLPVGARASTGPAFAQATAIKARAAELNSGGNVQANKATLAANSKALATQVGYLNTTQRAFNTANDTLAALTSWMSANGINPSQFPDINAFNNFLKSKGLDPGAAGGYNAQIATLRAEYAQVLARGGTVTDTARNEANSLIPTNLSPAQLQTVANRIQIDGQNVVNDAQKQVKTIQDQINGIIQTSSGADTTDIQNDIQSAIKDTANVPNREALIPMIAQEYGISTDQAASYVYQYWPDNATR